MLRISIQAAKSEPERVQYQEELATHQELASQGYRVLRSDTEASKLSDDFLVITFDLMQNLPVPTLTHALCFICANYGSIILVYMLQPLDQLPCMFGMNLLLGGERMKFVHAFVCLYK